MQKRRCTAACPAYAGLLIFAVGAAAQTSGPPAKPNAADQKFAMEAAQGGMAEVELGTLAKDKASSAAVKEFGQRMIDDHTKANEQLKSIASREGITLPTSIGAKNQAQMDRLSKLSGKEFDAAYMKLMLNDHKKDVSEFQKEAGNGKSTELKKFASDTLPTLKDHLQLAGETAAKIGGESADRAK